MWFLCVSLGKGLVGTWLALSTMRLRLAGIEKATEAIKELCSDSGVNTVPPGTQSSGSCVHTRARVHTAGGNADYPAGRCGNLLTEVSRCL